MQADSQLKVLKVKLEDSPLVQRYTLYVDESGDQDLERFRDVGRSHGSDPYLVFGAALVPNNLKADFRKKLADIQRTIGAKELHCADLSHLKVSYLSNSVKNMRVLLFGAVSKKKTVGTYKEKISGKKQAEDYYNKCVHYLLERVGEFMSENGIEPSHLSIVFEKKRHNYERLRSYIRTIQARPVDARARFLQRIDSLSITAQGKADEPLLALADVTAYSLYQCFNETLTNYGLPEQRYFREIKSKFWSDPETGVVANKGIKFIKGPVDMGLTGQTLER